MSALGAVCASAVVALEAAIVAAPASFPTSRRVKCVADIESSHGIRLPFFGHPARSPILDMKRMLSKMDRSPTLEDRNSNVRFGSKQTYAAHKHMSALPPKRTCAVQLVMSALGQQRTSGRPQTNTATRGRITLISVNSPGCVLLRYSGLGPLLETTRGLDRIVIEAIVVARERP